MEVFEGTVRLAGDTVSLPAKLLVAGDRLKVSAYQHEIGDWKLTDITASLLADECHIKADGEELIVSVPEPIRLAEAIGPRWTNPGDGSLLRPRRPTSRKQSFRQVAAAFDKVPYRWRMAGLAAVGIVALGVLAPAVLVALILLSAIVGLVVGGFAAMDPFTAVRLPSPVTPSLLIQGGTAGVALAIVLAVVT